MNQECLARLDGVAKRYGKITALDHLDLEIGTGELLAVLGPNGAGKTTAISLLLGLQPADEGTVQLFGRSPRDIEARRHVGVMMQDVGLAAELRVRELIELFSSYYPAPYSVTDVLKITGALPLADRPYGKLSGGQKRQVQFALAVCGRPKLLFLDEPTVGLDIQAREAMWAALRELIGKDCSIVLTTHYLEEAEALADRVVVIANGRVIASGSINEMQSLVSQKRISCVTEADEDLVASWPGVESVSKIQGKMRIVASNAEEVVFRLMNVDRRISELQISRAGLAEVFAQLMQEVI
jgi:ABC-2 type transport system ATP-binding protein